MRKNVFQQFTCPHTDLRQVSIPKDDNASIYLNCLSCNKTFDAKLKIPKGTVRVYMHPTELRELETKLRPEVYASKLKGHPVPSSAYRADNPQRFQSELLKEFKKTTSRITPNDFMCDEDGVPDMEQIMKHVAEAQVRWEAMTPEEKEQLFARNMAAINYELNHPITRVPDGFVRSEVKLTDKEMEDFKTHFEIHRNDGTAEVTARIGNAPIAKTTFHNEELNRMAGNPLLPVEEFNKLFPEDQDQPEEETVEEKQTEEEPMDDKTREKFNTLYDTDIHGAPRGKEIELTVTGTTHEAVKENLYRLIHEFVGPYDYEIIRLTPDAVTPRDTTTNYRGEQSVLMWEQRWIVYVNIYTDGKTENKEEA